MGNKRSFLGQFVGFDDKLLHQKRKPIAKRQNGYDPHPAADQQQFQFEPVGIVGQKNAPEDRNHHQNPEGRNSDMDIRITGTESGPLGGIEQPVDLQVIAQGHQNNHDTRKHEKMVAHFFRNLDFRQ